MEKEISQYHLNELQIFQKMDNEKIPMALQCMGARVVQVEKDTYLQHIGDKVIYLGVILQGSAYQFNYTASEERNIHTHLERGNLIGSTAVFAQNGIARDDIMTTTTCMILQINPEQFKPERAISCPHRYRIMQNLLYMVANENVLLQEKINLMSHETLRGKIYSYLYTQYKINKTREFTIPFIHRFDFADYLGANVTALSRELGRMRDEGILSFHKNQFILHKIPVE